MIAGRQANVLEDDGYITNVLSKSFVESIRDIVDVRTSPATISHSSKDTVEETNETVVHAEIEIGNNRYKSNWIVSDCRHDVILGMPWHL